MRFTPRLFALLKTPDRRRGPFTLDILRMGNFKAALSLLIEQKPLPASYNDHPLKGDWKGWRDLHIEPTGCCSIAYRAPIWSLPAQDASLSHHRPPCSRMQLAPMLSGISGISH